MKHVPLTLPVPGGHICSCGRPIKTKEAKVCKACRLAVCKASQYQFRTPRPPATTTPHDGKEN